MLPINVMYDSGIDEFEETAIINGLGELDALFPGMNIRVYGASAWCEGEYSSADWYVRNTRIVPRIDRAQLDAGDLIDLIAGEPWQEAEPHIDVMFTSYDLAAVDGGQYLNFVFGMADGRITVQSVARYRGLPDFDCYLAIKAVVQHELGHIFGMASDLGRTNTEYNLGPHCTNSGCIMRQGLSVPEWVQHARESHEMGRIYCPQCLADKASAYDIIPAGAYVAVAAGGNKIGR